MQVSIRVEVQKELINVELAGSRDIDSVNLDIYYGEEQIGQGHYNHKNNWAHVYLENDNHELEDFLVNGIESRDLI